MNDKHGELLDGLDWYWSRKVEAYRGFESLDAASFSVNARRYYGEYFLYLVSAMDLLGDFDESFKTYIKTVLEGYGGQSGKNNFQYIRHLRHSMIHQGADITSAGVTVNGIICPLSPPVLTAVWGETFVRFSPFVTVLVFFCEAKIGPAIEEFMDRKQLWDRDPATSLAVAVGMLRAMEHASATTKLQLEQIMNDQARIGALPFNTFQTLRASLKTGVSSEADLLGLLSEAEAWWANYRSNL
ncbi:hypothetical protein C4K00_0217 [Pseudomonas synxantha]|uniref:hypothetical protein n=1 Tax=Pseudomonas synxantha TaxID=47883 RepID=UPI000F561B05|nr:hypothetical protein [Pseudomonas synxantha]AZE70479.1 hypothetical protein C4K00_0217 [Pseudomonas synxantha]